MAYHAMGDAMMMDITTNARNSFDNNAVMLNTDAPNTFLTPISFILFSAI